MTTFALNDDMDELSSAEDFLNYFDITFEQNIVHINRLHIMQRYHDYIQKAARTLAEADTDELHFKIHQALIQQAYDDFVSSDALTEKVFKVFKKQDGQSDFVSVEQLLGA